MRTSESPVHVHLSRRLRNAIDDRPTHHGITYSDVVSERRVDSGYADVVVETDGGPFLVVEAKRPEAGTASRDVDPYSPAVVDRAFQYADRLGTPYFATYNGNRLVLFRTSEEGAPPLDRRTRAYDVHDVETFAGEFLEDLAGLDAGAVDWDPHHEAFVGRLETFHARLAAAFESTLDSRLEADDGFRDQFRAWVADRDWTARYEEAPAEVKAAFVEQAAYAFTNELVFVEAVDLEAGYEHDPVFDGLPLNDRAEREVTDLLAELQASDLSQFDHDVIGQVYEEVIPPDERHALGQYYTPPAVVDLVTRLTITDPDDTVFDPACGSGAFLVGAYNRLDSLGGDEGTDGTDGKDHAELLDQLYGTDVNRYPTHLAAVNLALQDPGTETGDLNVERADFFHVRPGQSTGGTVYPDDADAVVANPPYVRQENIPDKREVRAHLAGREHDGAVEFVDLDERSDLYAYFFTHAAEFLGDDGRMGMITPDKWLSVGYGRGLQRFFCRNFRIEAVVGFARRVFDDPLVPTCVTVLSRERDRQARREHVVPFVRLRRQQPPDDIEALVRTDYDPDVLIDEDAYRVVTKRQATLAGEGDGTGKRGGVGKWGRFLHAPSVYWDRLGHERVCRLGAVAGVARGITSGANDFFYLDGDEAERWGVDDRFLTPLVKSVRGVDVPAIAGADTDRSVLDVHSYVEAVRRREGVDSFPPEDRPTPALPPGADPEAFTAPEVAVLRALRADGYDGLFEYVVHATFERDWGRRDPPHERATCRGHRSRRGCWFDLGPLDTGPLLVSKEYWAYGAPLAVCNRAGVVPDQQLYYVDAGTEVDPAVLGGILNASWGALVRELHGRTTGGGMNRVTVYEAEDLPIPDPRELPSRTATAIADAFRDAVDDGKTRTEALDEVVMQALGVPGRVEEVRDAATALSRARRERTEEPSVPRFR